MFSLSPVSHSGTNINQPNEEKEIKKHTRLKSCAYANWKHDQKFRYQLILQAGSTHTHTQREPQTVAINYSETGS